MTGIKELYQRILKAETNPAPIAAIIGLAFPLIAWIIEFIRFKVAFGFKGIGQIHQLNPVIYLVDLAPFILGFLAFLFRYNGIPRKTIFNEDYVSAMSAWP